MRKPWRRRRPVPLLPSDFERELGQLWAVNAPVNSLLQARAVGAARSERPIYNVLDTPVSLRTGAAKCHVAGLDDLSCRSYRVQGPDGTSLLVCLPASFSTSEALVIVNLPSRLVHEVHGIHRERTGWAAQRLTVSPLDGEGDGVAKGLVLEREMAARAVRHRVAVAADLPVGTTLGLVIRPPSKPLAVQIVVDALADYGAEVRESRPGPIEVLIERSGSGGNWPNDPGPLYRAAGLATTCMDVPGLVLGLVD